MTSTRQQSRLRRSLRPAAARAAVVTILAVIGTAGTAHADAKPRPVPRDANGNLTNTVTSTSPGANCTTGTEPGCTTTITHVVTRAVPVIGDDAAAIALGVPMAIGGVMLRRRRSVLR
jgi:hypothetical protein